MMAEDGNVVNMGRSGKILASVITRSWAIPDGMKFEIEHERGCRGGSTYTSEMVMGVVKNVGPRTVTELEVCVGTVLKTVGCGNGCGINKTTSAGVLFRHSQDSEYSPPTKGSTQSTDSQGTTRGSPLASEISSWGNSTILDRLPSSERALYKGYRQDRSSDESYVPPATISKELSMDLGGGTNTEGNGIGNSKHAVINREVSSPEKGTTILRRMRWDVPTKRDSITDTPVETLTTQEPTVPYGGSSIDLALLEAVRDIENGDTVTPVCDRMVEDEEEEEVKVVVESTLSDHDKILRLEKRVCDMGDEYDDLRDQFEVLISDIKEGKIGCTKCKVDVKGKGRATGVAVADNTRTRTLPPAIPMATQVPVGRTSTNERKGADVPTYKKESASFAGEKESWAKVTAPKDNQGFTKVIGRAERKTVTKKMVVKPLATEKERHLKIRFVGARGMVHMLPLGVTTEIIRVKLNNTLKELNIDAYFAKSGKNKWGDIEMTLARTKAEDLIMAGNAMKEALIQLGLKDFSFVRDTKKVKLYVAMVPLTKRGAREWEVSDWNTANAFDEMAADIESSNPGVYVSARPSWVGKLGILKERKHNSAGLTILCEETAELKRIMAGNEPRMLVGGRKRFCRVWRESSDTIICDRCLTVGHSLPECKATPECRWCGKGHLSTDHKCPIVDCAAPKGMACMHCRKWCKLCETGNHYSGFRECTVLRGRGASQRKYGRATPIDADNTSAEGVSDRSRNRFRQTNPRVRNTPVDEQVRNKEMIGDRTSKPTRVAKARSSSVPSGRRNVREEGEVTLSQW